ncbi:hypothetical protein BOTBODRAFT_476604 [Botryobasidium botryosum FD-172 SS1]|uniref:Uncharacterized protein n=1 Tax=Botryobasidium botryosum (strain FD-172 SS1) TaxID=930990 RepID=A0A067MT77_BOTB1|nr:hypothetical protein BOTBODRAFT_476604 [Botryobasidium botryosum FD-172 SS1]
MISWWLWREELGICVRLRKPASATSSRRCQQPPATTNATHSVLPCSPFHLSQSQYLDLYIQVRMLAGDTLALLAVVAKKIDSKVFDRAVEHSGTCECVISIP